MSNFQITILGIFGFFIIVGILIFSGLIPGMKGSGGRGGDLGGTVVVWGTIPKGAIADLVDNFNREHKPTVLSYLEKNRASFDRDLTEALAGGQGPDVVMLPRELIYRHADKLLAIPYSSISERAFKDTFVEEGELFLDSESILALPLIIDPMVMYFNRDILSNAGISLPPKTWEELLAITPNLVEKDQSGNLTRSAVAFGESSNVLYAKDIIVLLSLQAGDKIITRDSGGFRVVFGRSADFSTLNPAEEALRYYTNFSNPVQPVYSWNKSLANSKNAFISGKVAFYFGYAGELFGIREKNPHLNFDVAKVPQTKGSSVSITIGDISGLAIIKVSKNAESAFQVISAMAGQDFSAELVNKISLPSARRDVLAQKPTDAYMNVFFSSALMSRGWIDPSPLDTSKIFSDLVENIVSGRLNIGEAVRNSSGELDRLLRK